MHTRDGKREMDHVEQGGGEEDGGQMAFPCFGSSFGRCFDLTCTHVKTNSNARELFLVQTFKFFRSLAEIQNPLPWWLCSTSAACGHPETGKRGHFS